MSEDKKTTEAKATEKKVEKAKDTKTPEIKPGMTVKVHETIREKNAKGDYCGLCLPEKSGCPHQP